MKDRMHALPFRPRVFPSSPGCVSLDELPRLRIRQHVYWRAFDFITGIISNPTRIIHEIWKTKSPICVSDNSNKAFIEKRRLLSHSGQHTLCFIPPSFITSPRSLHLVGLTVVLMAVLLAGCIRERHEVGKMVHPLLDLSLSRFMASRVDTRTAMRQADWRMISFQLSCWNVIPLTRIHWDGNRLHHDSKMLPQAKSSSNWVASWPISRY